MLIELNSDNSLTNALLPHNETLIAEDFALLQVFCSAGLTDVSRRMFLLGFAAPLECVCPKQGQGAAATSREGTDVPHSHPVHLSQEAFSLAKVLFCISGFLSIIDGSIVKTLLDPGMCVEGGKKSIMAASICVSVYTPKDPYLYRDFSLPINAPKRKSRGCQSLGQGGIELRQDKLSLILGKILVWEWGWSPIPDGFGI